MQRLRLVLLVGLVLALSGAVVANGQEGTSVFNNSEQKSGSKQQKSKAKDNSGHRKHWYSLPHWFHKNHDKNSTAGKSKANPFDKPATNQKVASTESKPVAAGTKPAGKAVATTNSVAKTGGTAGTKTVAAAHPGTKTATGTRHRKKTVAGASQGKKTVRHDCTPELAKKGGCTVDKAHSQKGSANPS